MPRIATWAIAALTMAWAPLAGLAQPATAVADGVTHSASVLPEDTFIHITVPDADAFSDRYNESNGAGLFTGDEMAPLREKFLQVWGQANAVVQGQLGFTVDEILANAKGELAFAVTQAPGTTLGGVLFIGFEDEAIVDKLIEQVESAYEGQGGQITRVSTGGVEISTAAIPNGEIDAEMLSMNYFVHDSTWVIGTNRGILETIVENWDGDSRRTLANSEIYSDMLEKVNLGQNRAPAMLAFADPITLVKEVGTLVSQINPEAAMPVGMAIGFLPITGLEGLLGMMQATDFATTEGYDGISKQFVYCEKPVQGILKVFSAKTRDQTPPSWVPATAASYAGFSWAVEGAYNEVERLVDNTLGQPGLTAAKLDELRDMPGGPGIHIKEDILDQLEGTVRSVSIPGTTESVEELGGRQLFALELQRTHNMGEVLGRIADTTGGQLEERGFNGTTIYEFDMPTQSPNGEVGSKTAGIAVAQDHLMFATDVQLLEEVIRGDTGDALVDSDAYQTAVAKVPTEGVSLSYSNTSEALRPIYSFLQTGGFNEAIEQTEQGGLILSLIADLPPFDSIAKYFGSTVGYAVEDADGLLSTQIYFSGK